MKSINNGPTLFVGGLSGRVYFAPRSKVVHQNSDGDATMIVVGKKYDVTESFDSCIKARARAKRVANKHNKIPAKENV